MNERMWNVVLTLGSASLNYINMAKIAFCADWTILWATLEMAILQAKVLYWYGFDMCLTAPFSAQEAAIVLVTTKSQPKGMDASGNLSFISHFIGHHVYRVTSHFYASCYVAIARCVTMNNTHKVVRM